MAAACSAKGEATVAGSELQLCLIALYPGSLRTNNHYIVLMTACVDTIELINLSVSCSTRGNAL